MLLFSRAIDWRDRYHSRFCSWFSGLGVSDSNNAGDFEHHGREQLDEGNLCVFLFTRAHRAIRFGRHIDTIDAGRSVGRFNPRD